MKIVIFTGNSIRHKFLANALTKSSDDALVISECHQCDYSQAVTGAASAINEHFQLRAETEKLFFPGNDVFLAKTLPVLYKEANSRYVFEVVKGFAPEAMFVFGASIIKEPLLSLLPEGRFINLHLGLSPYYRGSGTNFWPLVNQELEFVGATILSIDPGIDTGNIICHVRPKVEINDDVHIIGCKVIKAGAECLIEIISLLRRGKKLNSVKQWKAKKEKYYRNSDFNENSLFQYKKNLSNGLIAVYLRSPEKNLKLIALQEK